MWYKKNTIGTYCDEVIVIVARGVEHYAALTASDSQDRRLKPRNSPRQEGGHE